MVSKGENNMYKFDALSKESLEDIYHVDIDRMKKEAKNLDVSMTDYLLIKVLDKLEEILNVISINDEV